MSHKNFLLFDSSLEGLNTGDRVRVGGGEGHHGARVMRLREGESVLVTDTHAYQAEATVAAVRKSEFDVVLSQPPLFHAVRTPQLTLVQGLAKGGRDEAAVEFATELGVDRVIPWQAHRSIVHWKGDKAVKGHAKWLATVHAAVKQSRRATIPMVEEAVTSASLVSFIAEETRAGNTVVLLHESGADGFSRVISDLARANEQGEAPKGVAIIVGPEGGVSDDEVAAYLEAGARVARLGDEILRASSAGPAALAALCAVVGRWQ